MLAGSVPLTRSKSRPRLCGRHERLEVILLQRFLLLGLHGRNLECQQPVCGRQNSRNRSRLIPFPIK